MTSIRISSSQSLRLLVSTWTLLLGRCLIETSRKSYFQSQVNYPIINKDLELFSRDLIASLDGSFRQWAKSIKNIGGISQNFKYLLYLQKSINLDCLSTWLIEIFGTRDLFIMHSGKITSFLRSHLKNRRRWRFRIICRVERFRCIYVRPYASLMFMCSRRYLNSRFWRNLHKLCISVNTCWWVYQPSPSFFVSVRKNTNTSTSSNCMLRRLRVLKSTLKISPVILKFRPVIAKETTCKNQFKEILKSTT